MALLSASPGGRGLDPGCTGPLFCALAALVWGDLAAHQRRGDTKPEPARLRTEPQGTGKGVRLPGRLWPMEPVFYSSASRAGKAGCGEGET